MQASLRIHMAGWKVVWDPEVAVDHFPAPRFDEDSRDDPTLRAIADVLHNEVYILLSLLTGWRRVTAVVYGFLVGTRREPGVLMLPCAALANRSWKESAFGFQANLYGRACGLVTFVRAGGQSRLPN